MLLLWLLLLFFGVLLLGGFGGVGGGVGGVGGVGGGDDFSVSFVGDAAAFFGAAASFDHGVVVALT